MIMNAHSVINAGVGGDCTRMLLARLDADVLSHHPSLVILMVGTNDALNTSCLVPIGEYRENLAMLCQRITAHSALLLATVLPCYMPYLLERHSREAYGVQGPQERIQQINTVIHKLASTMKIPLVDLYRIFTAVGNCGEDPSSLLRNQANSGDRDGVHPTVNGYRVLAGALFQAIIDHQLPPHRVVCFGDSITYGAHVLGEGSITGETYPAFLHAVLTESFPTR